MTVLIFLWQLFNKASQDYAQSLFLLFIFIEFLFLISLISLSFVAILTLSSFNTSRQFYIEVSLRVSSHNGVDKFNFQLDTEDCL